MTARPRRSCLYMPGANTKAMEKAKTLAADVLLLDLEDSVAPDAKEAARDQVAAPCKPGIRQREVSGVNAEIALGQGDTSPPRRRPEACGPQGRERRTSRRARRRDDERASAMKRRSG